MNRLLVLGRANRSSAVQVVGKGGNPAPNRSSSQSRHVPEAIGPGSYLRISLHPRKPCASNYLSAFPRVQD